MNSVRKKMVLGVSLASMLALGTACGTSKLNSDSQVSSDSEISYAEIYVGMSSYSDKYMCELHIQKNKDDKTVGMLLIGIAKSAANGVDTSVAAKVKVRDKLNEADMNFNTQPSVKYPGMSRIAYMSQTVSSVKSESFIVSNKDFKKVIGFSTVGDKSFEIECDDMKVPPSIADSDRNGGFARGT